MSKSCIAREHCHRNEASGTQPTTGRQSYGGFDDGKGYDCRYFWPTREYEDDLKSSKERARLRKEIEDKGGKFYGPSDTGT